MRDPVNPTPAELIEWAYSTDATYDQDFDAIVASPEFSELLLQIADDDQCPNQLFFLHCLYRLVGASVASNGKFMPESDVRRLIKSGASGQSASLRRWAGRATVFVADPNAFDPSTWLDGGWAIDDEIWRDGAAE